MSLEDALNRLAVAIEGQTALLQSGAGAAPAAPAEPVKATAKKAAPAAKAAEAATTEADIQHPPYTEVQAAVNALANAKGRDPVLSILAQYGAKKGQDLKPEDYTAVITDLKNALESEDGLA